MSRKLSTVFGTMDSGTKFTSLIYPPSLVGSSLIFQLGESYRSKLKDSCLQKSTPKQAFHKVQTWIHYFFLSMSMTCQILVTTRLTRRNLQMTSAMGRESKYRFSSGTSAEGPWQTGKVVCQMDIKTESRKNKSHNILQVPNCNKGRTCPIFPSFFRTILT